jgi:hypothetical protein
MTDMEQLGTLAGKMIEQRSPDTGEQLIAHQQMFINFQQMMFWLGAFDQMKKMSASKRSTIQTANA